MTAWVCGQVSSICCRTWRTWASSSRLFTFQVRTCRVLVSFPRWPPSLNLFGAFFPPLGSKLKSPDELLARLLTSFFGLVLAGPGFESTLWLDAAEMCLDGTAVPESFRPAVTTGAKQHMDSTHKRMKVAIMTAWLARERLCPGERGATPNRRLCWWSGEAAKGGDEVFVCSACGGVWCLLTKDLRGGLSWFPFDNSRISTWRLQPLSISLVFFSPVSSPFFSDFDVPSVVLSSTQRAHTLEKKLCVRKVPAHESHRKHSIRNRKGTEAMERMGRTYQCPEEEAPAFFFFFLEALP